ncbi:MAG: DUF4375 domain-containing protein [Sphingobacteriales bacterium]|nr:MAG: DUF4375 domain-containing protein [Sphingobacteriales bacterium]
MSSKFLPHIPSSEYNDKLSSERIFDLYELLSGPLHEEMYKRQDFNFLDDLSQGQQLLISYDYVRMQVQQGGFIQLIQNGYIGLLPDMPEWLAMVGADDMAKVIDDALKVYVLNRELLDKETTVEEFAKLYDELKEFEIIDERFREADAETVLKITDYVKAHIEEFAIVE